MTRKEKLVTEWNDINNKINEIKGLELYELKNGQMESLCRSNTVAELETMIRSKERELEKVREAKRAEDYFNTPTGKLVKESLETQLLFAKQNAKTVIEEAHDALVKVIRERYGERWGVNSFSIGYSFDLAMTDEEKGGFKFGHGFTVYFDERRWGEPKGSEPCPAINYGTMGPFKIKQEPDRVAYLKVLADVAQGSEWVIDMCKEQLAFNERLDAVHAIIDMLQDKLKHPLK